MPGDGTSLVTTTNSPPPARVLDITRLARRAGRRLTGVDRVELAYVNALANATEPCFGLAKTSFGYILIRPSALLQVVNRICSGNMRKADLLSRLANRLTAPQRQAETELRGFAVARGRPFQLERMLRRHVKRGFAYLNTGHSNITTDVTRAVKAAGGRVVVFVHDMIPLDYPEFQRHGVLDNFRKKMQVVQKDADLIICNSKDTQERTVEHLAAWGPVPDSVVAHLGVEPVQSLADVSGIRPEGAYLMCIGTIEPRKNVGFLLDLWDQMGESAPHLLICGARGWRNEDVFAKLDALPKTGRVRELNGLSDAVIAGLLDQCNGLVFPSIVEGYGLPAVEAARAGVPILCNNLEIYQEILGDYPTLACVNDQNLWINHIQRLANDPPEHRTEAETEHLTWDNHFKVVLSLT